MWPRIFIFQNSLNFDICLFFAYCYDKNDAFDVQSTSDRLNLSENKRESWFENMGETLETPFGSQTFLRASFGEGLQTFLGASFGGGLKTFLGASFGGASKLQ